MVYAMVAHASLKPGQTGNRSRGGDRVCCKSVHTSGRPDSAVQPTMVYSCARDIGQTVCLPTLLVEDSMYLPKVLT